MFRKFISFPKDEKLLLLEAVFFVFFSKTLLFFPFKYCIKWIQESNEVHHIPDPRALWKIKVAINRANRLAFWKNICLVQSFAARLMLKRRNIGSTLYLGLQLDHNKQMIAHAWLVSNERMITPKGTVQYKEIFSI